MNILFKSAQIKDSTINATILYYNYYIILYLNTLLLLYSIFHNKIMTVIEWMFLSWWKCLNLWSMMLFFCSWQVSWGSLILWCSSKHAGLIGTCSTVNFDNTSHYFQFKMCIMNPECVWMDPDYRTGHLKKKQATFTLRCVFLCMCLEWGHCKREQ